MAFFCFAVCALNLNNNADHTAVAVIDDFLHGILQLHLALVVHHRNLIPDAVLHQLSDRLAENIGLPRALLTLLAFFDVGDQIIGLLLAPHNRSDLRLDIGLFYMDLRGNRFHLHPEFIPVTNQDRLLHADVGEPRSDHAVAFDLHRLNGI